MQFRLLIVLLGFGLALGGMVRPSAADNEMLDPDNLKLLGCTPPDLNYQVIKVGKPGAIFYPGEEAVFTVQVTRKDAPLTSVTIGVQEVSTRQGKLYDQKPMGWSMTPPPVVDVIGKRETVDVPVTIDDKPGATARIDVKLPLPQRYSCYVITIAPNGQNAQFLGSALRAMKPIDGFSTDVPMMAEGGSFLEGGLTDESRKSPQARRERLAILTRLGIKAARWELPGMWGWSKKTGEIDWSHLDEPLQMMEEAKIKLVVTLGAVSYEAMPFTGPTPGIVNWMQDHTPTDAYLDTYSNWVFEFCKRFGKNGNGSLWAIECWNEPWEPLSTSGWESDSPHYRAVFKAMADGIHKANAGVSAVTAGSTMNLEDKFLTGDDRAEWMSRIDMISDHYVMPPNNYGSMLMRKWGNKPVIETETWGASTEMLAFQFVTQFLACGDKMIDPMQSPMMYYNTPGGTDEFRFPKPASLAANVLNVFLTGRPFQRMLFLQHLPFAFQFGKDPDAVVIVLGRLRPNLSAFGGGTTDSIWWQLNRTPGGTIAVDNADGQLEAYDMAGNRAFEHDKTITIPMDLQGWFLRSPKGGVALISKRLQEAKIDGARPVEIIAHDLGAQVGAGTRMTVTLHNLLNRPINGALSITAPSGITLRADKANVELKPGEQHDVELEMTSGTSSAANAYDFAYAFDSDAGKAEWKETLHVLLAPRATKTIDGNLDDWKDEPGVPVRATAKKADATLQAWQPFNKFVEQQPDGSYAELKAAYDDKFFYIAARVYDPAPQTPHVRLATWDQDQYFYSSKDNEFCESLSEYKSCFYNPTDSQSEQRAHADPKWPALEKLAQSRPEILGALKSGMLSFYWSRKGGNTPIDWSKAPHVYKKDFAPDSPYNGNGLQFAFNVVPGYEGHDLVVDTDRVTDGFHAMPDTDYEYAAYACTDGKAELWRLLAPGVPRGHYFPRQARSKLDQGPVDGGQCIVKRVGNITNYEIAIPWSELKEWKPQAGHSFGFTFRVNKASGPALVFGENKSATKTNGLTLHPYWSGQPSSTIQWTLGN